MHAKRSGRVISPARDASSSNGRGTLQRNVWRGWAHQEIVGDYFFPLAQSCSPYVFVHITRLQTIIICAKDFAIFPVGLSNTAAPHDVHKCCTNRSESVHNYRGVDVFAAYFHTCYGRTQLFVLLPSEV